jgi:RimJ/RimL family protein N-acetyltransferase
LLRPFVEADLAPFAALNTHPLVVESLGSTPTRAECDAMVERYTDELEREGWGFWAVGVPGETRFIGMVGLHRVRAELPCAPAVEVGWRLDPAHWGRGYATEAARASLAYGFGAGGLSEIVAFTTTLNLRSQSVMERVGMRRDHGADFDHPGVPEGSPLRRHVLYRATVEDLGDGTGTRTG